MITALLGALVNRATTIPALGVPVAAHSSTIVCWRPPHCARRRVHVSPMPVTLVTATGSLQVTAAR